MESAERVVTAGRHKAFHRNTRLITDISHESVQCVAVLFPGRPGNSAEKGDRLKVNPPHTGCERAGKGNKLSQIVIIHASDDRRHQGDAEVQVRADADGFPFFLQKGAPPQFFINVIPGAVKLQENNVQPRLGKGFCIGRVLRKADAVGVKLHIAAARLFRKADELRQIIAQGRLPSRKLQER